jgi:hypothetical protein
LALQGRKLFRRKLKSEIVGEPIKVSFHGSHELLRLYGIQGSQIGVDRHLLATKQRIACSIRSGGTSATFDSAFHFIESLDVNATRLLGCFAASVGRQ